MVELRTMRMRKFIYGTVFGLTLFVFVPVGATTTSSLNAIVPVINSRLGQNPLLTGAVVTGLSGNIIIVTAGTTVYSVTTTPETRFQRNSGVKSTLSEITVGDSLRIAGKRMGVMI